MFQFLTHVELSRSMAAILEMPQYVAYQKNVAYALLTLSNLTLLTDIATFRCLAALLTAHNWQKWKSIPDMSLPWNL